MPTILGPKYPVTWRGRPGHMLRVDVPIWYQFLEQEKERFRDVYYDCRLGGPGFTPSEYSEKLRGMWKYLGAKRADVIAETKDSIWIIEVTSEAKVKALGQLIMYKSLWQEDPKSPKPVEMILVCDYEDPTILAAAKSYGIRTFIVKGGANSTKAT